MSSSLQGAVYRPVDPHQLPAYVKLPWWENKKPAPSPVQVVDLAVDGNSIELQPYGRKHKIRVPWAMDIRLKEKRKTTEEMNLDSQILSISKSHEQERWAAQERALYGYNPYGGDGARNLLPRLTSDPFTDGLCEYSAALQGALVNRKRAKQKKEEAVATQWLDQQEEEAKSCGRGFVPPRILIVSNNVHKADSLMKNVVRRTSDVIGILYNFEKTSFGDLIGLIKRKLEEYKAGCRARSILFYTQGGPGYVYLLKRRVMTPQKLCRMENADLYWFWRELGALVSKLQPEEAYVYFMGCYVLGNKQGAELFEILRRVVQPNIVHFDAPLELSQTGRTVIEAYFDLRRYWMWKQNQHKSSDVVRWPSAHS